MDRGSPAEGAVHEGPFVGAPLAAWERFAGKLRQAWALFFQGRAIGVHPGRLSDGLLASLRRLQDSL